MKPLNTVLIGLGRIGWMLESDPYRYHPCTHAGTMLSLPRHFRIVAGCDIDEDRRRRFAVYAKKAGCDVALHAGIDSLLMAIRRHELTVDLVVLATGPEMHPTLFKKLLSVGVRRFLIEKPVALNAKEARQMLKLAELHEAMVWVNFERRYHPAYALLRRIVETERFGKLRHIEGRVLAPSLRRDALLEDAVHWVDLMLWYGGAPLDVHSTFRLDAQGREKGSLHAFRYEDFDAVLESGGMRKYFEFVMRLDFEQGRVIAGNDGHFHFQSKRSRRYKGFYDLQPVPVRLSKKEAAVNAWQELYREIARLSQRPSAEAGQKRARPEPRSSLAQAVAGIEWIDRCRRFHR